MVWACRCSRPVAARPGELGASTRVESRSGAAIIGYPWLVSLRMTGRCPVLGSRYGFFWLRRLKRLSAALRSLSLCRAASATSLSLCCSLLIAVIAGCCIASRARGATASLILQSLESGERARREGSDSSLYATLSAHTSTPSTHETPRSLQYSSFERRARWSRPRW